MKPIAPPLKNVAPPEIACEAETQDGYRKGHRCPNRRSIRIDGKNLCKRHAAWQALYLAMKAGGARRIKRSHPTLEPVPIFQEAPSQ